MSEKIQKLISLIVGVLAMSLAIGYLVFAWVEPTAPPPGDNVPAPINVGSVSQIKTGILGLGDLDSNYALTVATTTGGIKITNVSAISTFYAEDEPGDVTLFVIDADGNVGIGDTTPASLLTVGSGDLFQVNSSGNIVKIRNVSYSWPSAQGAANTFLRNDGAGNLSWATVPGGGDITGVIAGAGLTGGGLSGDVTLNVGAGAGISVAADTVSHADTSAQSSVDNTGGTVIQDVTLDTYGHVTGLGSVNLDTRYVLRTDWETHDDYPSDCPAGQFVTGIGDNLSCAVPPGGITCPDCDPRFVNVTGDQMTGNLGVGIAPSANYRIYSSGASYGIRADGSFAGGYFWDSDGTSFAYVGNVGYGVHAYGDTAGGSFHDRQGTSRTYIAYGDYGIYQYFGSKNYFDGNVGIGTTDPGANKLKVAGNTEITGNLQVNGNLTVAGSKASRVSTSQGEKLLFAIESPKIEFLTSGSGQLKNGQAEIEFDWLFKEAISDKIPIRVHLTPTSECNGLYVKEKSNDGFVVKGSSNGNCTFDWIAIGRRKGYEEVSNEVDIGK